MSDTEKEIAEIKTFQVEANGRRLDRQLVDLMPSFSRNQLQRLIKEEHVFANDAIAKANMRLKVPTVIRVELPSIAETEILAEDIPLDIVYEDADLLLIDKPSGLVVHPANGHESGTLVNAVLGYCPEVLKVGGERRPGIVHRLDKDTSGLILVAKHDESLNYLKDQFAERTIEKVYLALCNGQVDPPTALIDAPIGRSKLRRQKMEVMYDINRTTRPAQTRYETVTAYDEHTLLRCFPKTGRTHQIRVHLSYIGFPIVGDSVYGKRKQPLLRTRHFLHAHQLTFNLPSSGERVTFTAELPPKLSNVLLNLEG